MAQKTIYICDVCGAEKGATNHWYKRSANAKSFEIYTFNDVECPYPTAHYCGQQCVIKKLSEFMVKGA